MRAPRVLHPTLPLLPLLGALGCGGNVATASSGSSSAGTGGASATSSATTSSTGTTASSSTGTTASSSAGSSSAGSSSAGSSSAGSSSSTGSSSSGGAVYSAYNLVTNLPRYVIFKAEPALDRCVRLSVAMLGTGNGFGIQSASGWTVEQAEVTAHASDCALAGSYPVVTMTSVTANGGSGTLTQSPAQVPCMASIHATLTFSSSLPWVPASDALDADGLLLQGGGC